MNDRYPEGVILCHTHNRPFGECRHPQLTGEVADASKPVDPRQRLQSAHMRSFVEREPINADPHNGGLRGQGAPDEWQRRNGALPNTALVRKISSPRAREAQERQLSEDRKATVVQDPVTDTASLMLARLRLRDARAELVATLEARTTQVGLWRVYGGNIKIDWFTMPKPTLCGRLRRWWLDRVAYPLDDLRERVGERLETWPYGSILTQVTAAWYSREAASLPYAETYDVWWEGGPIARVWAPALHAALHLTHRLEDGDAFTFNGWRLRVLAIYETYYAYRVVPSWLYHPARAFLGLGRLNERAKRLAYRAGLLHPRVNEELRWSQLRRPEER